jgi:ABC-type nitrate/sulfonate/bicarbonate transport system ATPase subunit
VVEPLVDFRDLSMTFGSGTARVHALDHVSLSFDAGSFVCIVGPSGCGKTTLLQTLAGFVRSTAGEVLFESRPVEGPGPELGVVFQQPNLFPWMTVAGNAGFGLRMRGASRSDRAAVVERLLRMTACGNFTPDTRMNCPVACSSAWPSSAPSPTNRRCC